MDEKKDEAREYWMGLPVGVRFNADGTVTWMIDTSEAEEELYATWFNAYEDTYPEVAAISSQQLARDMVALSDSLPESGVVETN